MGCRCPAWLVPRRNRSWVVSRILFWGSVPDVTGSSCVCKICFPPSPDPRSQSALPTPGKGETLSLFLQGASPLHPRTAPGATRCTGWGSGAGGVLAPGVVCSTCPGGGDHLKRRSSPPPVPPLLGCPFPEGSRNLFVAEGAPSPVPRKVTRTRAAPGVSLGTWQPPGKSKPRGFSRGDARGETPCIPMPVPEGLLADRRFAGNAGAIPLRVL